MEKLVFLLQDDRLTIVLLIAAKIISICIRTQTVKLSSHKLIVNMMEKKAKFPHEVMMRPGEEKT